jgi:hypothetical protein
MDRADLTEVAEELRQVEQKQYWEDIVSFTFF